MTLLAFNELPVGAQIGVATTDRGTISGIAVPEVVGGFQPGLIILTDEPAANQAFNGDGSGGANVLSPITTIVRLDLNADTLTYDFQPAGCVAGWLVFFNLEGVDSSVTLEDDGSLILIGVTDTNPNDPTNPTDIPFPALYFTGTNWRLLRSRFTVS
jgi:hypothetical protein